MFIDPHLLFPGTIVVLAPHMDDEVLACGGTISRLSKTSEIHVIYATDGMKSPSPILPHDSISPDLGQVRMRESAMAMGLLGVPERNLHYLGFPEAELNTHAGSLSKALATRIADIRPDHILMPFRYDRHPDHLAINRAARVIHRQSRWRADLSEYFVYYRWRLLPGRDVRKFIRPDLLLGIDTADVASLKRVALGCFRSQTTLYYAWQTRPILTEALLDNVSGTPEYFLRYDHTVPGTGVFTGLVPWIRIVHRIEPRLQQWKYILGTSLRRALPLK